MASFDGTSTTDDVLDGVDLTGATVVVTGASAGLGVETARAIAARGAQVVGVVRDPQKARRALDAVGATGVQLYEADLASLASVRAFTDAFRADGHDRIHALIANAGIMACPEGTTVDRRLRNRGVRATALHPGGIPTDLGKYLTEETMNALVEARGATDVTWKTLPQGTATSVWAGFVAPAHAVGGRYCEDCAVAPEIEDPTVSPGVMSYALDPKTAAALWTTSEELVGETFSPSQGR